MRYTSAGSSRVPSERGDVTTSSNIASSCDPGECTSEDAEYPLVLSPCPQSAPDSQDS